MYKDVQRNFEFSMLVENWRGFLTQDMTILNCQDFISILKQKLFYFLLLRVKVCTKTDGTVNIHPKSVNVEETEFHYNWLVYHLKMRTSSVCEGFIFVEFIFVALFNKVGSRFKGNVNSAFVLKPSCLGSFLLYAIRLCSL